MAPSLFLPFTLGIFKLLEHGKIFVNQLMISAVVLTKNEEKNIKGCLESLRWCGELLVIDDHSSDKTVQIAKEFGAKVFFHRLNNDFAQKRNFGLSLAKSDWVFFLDADERVSPQLAKEIKLIVKETSCNAFNVRRYDFFGGKALKYGETANVWLLRLGRRGEGEWKRQVHEFWQVKGEVGELVNPIFHYPHPTITEFLKHINFYSTLHAEALYQEGVKISCWRIVINPLGKFLINWLWRLGFLDGMPGLIIALMMSLHSFLARAKLYLKWKK